MKLCWGIREHTKLSASFAAGNKAVLGVLCAFNPQYTGVRKQGNENMEVWLVYNVPVKIYCGPRVYGAVLRTESPFLK